MIEEIDFDKLLEQAYSKERLDKLDAFEKELRLLIKKHHIGIVQKPFYDKDGKYLKTDYYITIDSETFWMESIEDLFNKIIRNR